ncbi:glycosyltransferase family 2 protein [Candidatus Parcubacteria bacterium]|nr:glycosyltransferase family 2 protein [Candidatus Parcubacteria bacterium]
MAKRVFCIIPAYNEEDNISSIIQSVGKYVDEVVVVDDGSDDRTARIAEEEKAIVLRHVINRGQGAALETGNQYARKKQADVVVHFDADGQFKPDEIDKVISPVKSGEADVVFGSRFLGQASNMPWLKKHVIFPIARIISKLFWHANLSDPQSGFRAFNKKFLGQLQIENDGSAHCSEIIIKAFALNMKIKEVPITVSYNNFGQSIFGGKGRGMGGVQIIKDLIISKIIN